MAEKLLSRGAAHRATRGGALRLQTTDIAGGVEVIEADLTGVAYSPHRHDRYAVGVTVRGVQEFVYRGSVRRCLPGEIHVLHPDELHDGRPGTGQGFGYHLLYIDPALVLEALGGTRLPFVADPIVRRAAHAAELRSSLRGDPDDLDPTDVVVLVARFLAEAGGAAPESKVGVDLAAMTAVREHIRADPTRPYAAKEVEAVAGLDRWSVARQFRAAFGTSPSRYRQLRRLDLARSLARSGVPLAQAASLAGFADQSHLTRVFASAFGVTPSRWLRGLQNRRP